MTVDEGNGVSLGELGRNMDRLTSEVANLADKVNTLTVGDAVLGEKIGRLEKIIYGALGVAGAALVTAIVTAVVSLATR